MNNIAKWLIEKGFDFRTVTMCDGKRGLMVDTNYEGPHPTKECLEKQEAIMRKVKRMKSLSAESRGHYTAVLILEA